MNVELTFRPNLVRMPPPFQWIHKGQSNEAQTNPSNKMGHWGMAEWPNGRLGVVLKKYSRRKALIMVKQTRPKTRAVRREREGIMLHALCDFMTTGTSWSQGTCVKTGEEADRSARSFVSTISEPLIPRSRRVRLES